MQAARSAATDRCLRRAGRTNGVGRGRRSLVLARSDSALDRGHDDRLERRPARRRLRGVAEGGGIWAIAENPGRSTLLSTTFGGNRLEAAGARRRRKRLLAGRVTIGNSIVADGGRPDGKRELQSIPERHRPRSASTSTASTSAASKRRRPGQHGPAARPAADNGGLTQTMAPAAGSPAIDQGRSLRPDRRPARDRAADRPARRSPTRAAAGADGSDVGAVEFQPSNAFTLGQTDQEQEKRHGDAQPSACRRPRPER